MLGLGLIKGTIIGMGIGLMTGLVIKELCKKKKIKNLNGENKTDNDASWTVDLTKYKWKCRILLLNTTCYRDNNYKRSKELYQENIKEFHKRHVKLMSNRKKGHNFSIKLIGFDGIVKKEFDILSP